MRIELLRPQELDESLLARWRQIVTAVPQLSSPFFHPAYVQSLGTYRENLEIAVFMDGCHIAGFLPFERHNGCVARPPGLRLCDFQGVIAEAALPWAAAQFIQGADVAVWHFDHLLADQSLRHAQPAGSKRRRISISVPDSRNTSRTVGGPEPSRSHRPSARRASSNVNWVPWSSVGTTVPTTSSNP